MRRSFNVTIIFLVYFFVTTSIYITFGNNDECCEKCEAEYIGNIMLCETLDTYCYEYYNNIYQECIKNCNNTVILGHVE
jgi:hypothetical protein